MKVKYFICISFFVVSLTNAFCASPQSCTTINLTSPHEIFEDVPVYDQGGGQICFAYTAAQLIEGQRILGGHKYSQDHSINPLSLALSLAIANGASDIQQGGVACEAIEHARKTTICPTSKSFRDAGEIETIINDFNICKKNLEHKDCQRYKEIFSKNPEVLKQDNPLILVKKYVDTLCLPNERIKLHIPKCSNVNDESKSSVFFQKQVDDVFNSPLPRPVEIGYSMHLFSYGGNEQKKYKIARVTEPDVLNFSLRYKPHSSILLGRRKAASGKCQYLLRNTQGKSFCPSGIADRLGWECDPKSSGIWINEEELFDSVFQVSSIDENNRVEKMLIDLKSINENKSVPCPSN